MKRLSQTVFLVLVVGALSVLPAVAQWTTTSTTDEMTGATRHIAMSDPTEPTREMDFPYQDLEGRIVVACEGGAEMAILYFTKRPNLTDTDYGASGGPAVDTRVKFDDKIKDLRVRHESGRQSLTIAGDTFFIRDVMESSTALVELPWYGHGDVYFRFSLTGSVEAIQSIRSRCNR